MSETDLAATPPEDIATPPVEGDLAATPPVQADAAPDYEDRAMAMGWTPKGQFKGDPEKWVDAETFVRRGEEFLPFLKANNRRLEKELERANGKMATLEKGLETAIAHMGRAEKRGYEKATRDIQARLDEAAAAGDVQGVRDATDELVELTKEAAVPKETAKPEEKKPEWLADWEGDNPWFGTDRAMTGAAREIAQELADQGIVGAAQLSAVTKRIKTEFPHKFENPNRRQAAAVESGGLTPVKRGKTYADLPADARQMCDELCRDIKGFTKETYLRSYQW